MSYKVMQDFISLCRPRSSVFSYREMCQILAVRNTCMHGWFQILGFLSRSLVGDLSHSDLERTTGYSTEESNTLAANQQPINVEALNAVIMMLLVCGVWNKTIVDKCLKCLVLVGHHSK